jgi:hypothetical protein
MRSHLPLVMVIANLAFASTAQSQDVCQADENGRFTRECLIQEIGKSGARGFKAACDSVNLQIAARFPSGGGVSAKVVFEVDSDGLRCMFSYQDSDGSAHSSPVLWSTNRTTNGQGGGVMMGTTGQGGFRAMELEELLATNPTLQFPGVEQLGGVPSPLK